MTSPCSHGSVYGPSRDDPAATVYLRADCRKLSCEYCGPKKAATYRRAVAKRAEENKLQRFLTLTLDPKKIPSDVDSVSYIRQCWAKFRVYLGRKYGSALSYISIVELHEGKRGKLGDQGGNYGKAHLHILISSYIPKEWISATWAKLGGGWKIDIRFVDVHRVAGYLSKYITKDTLLQVPWRKKRISTSRNIRLFDPKVKSGFRITFEKIESLFDWLHSGTLFRFKFDGFGLQSFLFKERGAAWASP
jgi:hypothetical protein